MKRFLVAAFILLSPAAVAQQTLAQQPLTQQSLAQQPLAQQTAPQIPFELGAEFSQAAD